MHHTVLPPPPLVVDDESRVRRDIESDDVRRTFPDMPVQCTSAQRNAFLSRLDQRAYDSIRGTTPGFTPPPLQGSPRSSSVSSNVPHQQTVPTPKVHSKDVSVLPPLR